MRERDNFRYTYQVSTKLYDREYDLEILDSMLNGLGDIREYTPIDPFDEQVEWGDVFMICIPMGNHSWRSTDMRFQHEIIERIIRIIDIDRPRIPIVIVGTKWDLFPSTNVEERTSETQLREFCDQYKREYIITSAKDTLNIAEAFEMAVHEATGVPQWELRQMEEGHSMVLEEVVRKPKCVLM
jgi:hypothetical protein